jgi:hypothetical protein
MWQKSHEGGKLGVGRCRTRVWCKKMSILYMCSLFVARFKSKPFTPSSHSRVACWKFPEVRSGEGTHPTSFRVVSPDLHLPKFSLPYTQTFQSNCLTPLLSYSSWRWPLLMLPNRFFRPPLSLLLTLLVRFMPDSPSSHMDLSTNPLLVPLTFRL